MVKTVKELAREISQKNNVDYNAVVHMFKLIKFNVDNKTKIDRDDLAKFSKKNKVNLATSAKLLADCQLALID